MIQLRRPLLWFAAVALLWVGGAAAATDAVGPPADDMSAEQLGALADSLEDPQQRERLIAQLRALARAQQVIEPGDATVKTAASELIEALAARIAGASRAADSLLATLQRLPDAAGPLLHGLRDAETRGRWLRIAGRLIAVLGAGFIAAALAGRALRRLRHKVQDGPRSLLRRLLHLCGFLLLDLLPILAFAGAAYGVLALVDPRAETRYIAVILINASILSRLLLATSAFLFAPQTPAVRLWDELDDETAHYVHQWVRRLSLIAIYGFFGLQAGLYLGLEQGAYQMLLRLLGLVIVGLLLVLVAQNRAEVADAIAGTPPPPTAEGREPPRLSSMRRGVARVWHLIAGLYLIVVYAIWALQVEDAALFVVRATLLSLLVIAVSQLLLRGVAHLFEHGLRLSDELRRSFPGLERRLNRYFPALQRVLRIGIGLFALLLVASAWGLDTLGWLTSGSGRVLFGAVFNVVLIVVVALFLWELASGSIERYLTDADGNVRERSARTRTLLTVARNALMVVLIVVATLMVLSELGVNIGPLLAGAGVVGLAIGFGSQRLVQDVINGAFILFQDLMAVGDVVKLGDKAGLVEALSIRTVRLRDLSGTVHTIPFSAIEGVSNLTREFSFYVFDIGIAYREDVDEVIALLKAIGEELRDDAVVGPLILDPLEVFGLDAFGDSAIVIKGRIKTQPIKQWQVGRAFNRLVKLRFDEHGIEIPFPHRTLYFGEQKGGGAPPAYVQLEMLRAAAAARPDGGA